MLHKREVDLRRESLTEIRAILGGMKSLSTIEAHKLGRYTTAQHRVCASVTAAVEDFLRHHPLPLPSVAAQDIWLVIGTERGFCGPLNDSLIAALEKSVEGAAVIAVGSRLSARMQDIDCRQLTGASVADEITAVLQSIVEALYAMRTEHGLPRLQALYHLPTRSDPVRTRILPPPRVSRRAAPVVGYAPWLNVSPPEFLADLIDHYVFSTLHGILFDALLCEHLARIEHLNAAVQRLDDKLEELKRIGDRLRQEEITEEIEIMLLGG